MEYPHHLETHMSEFRIAKEKTAIVLIEPQNDLHKIRDRPEVVSFISPDEQQNFYSILSILFDSFALYQKILSIIHSLEHAGFCHIRFAENN